MDTRSYTTFIPRLLIRSYQLASKGMTPRCRFSPSCSDYTAQALNAQGLLKGLWLGTLRIFKCHPWHPGGYDPVASLRHPPRSLAGDPSLTFKTMMDSRLLPRE